MNTLSWLIYLADAANSLDWLFGAITILGIIALGICALVAIDNSMNDDEISKFWRVVKLLCLTVFGSVIIGSAIPSKETVYAIAASEMGERAIHTQTGGKAVQALNHWLDKQIADDKPSDDDKKD